MIWLVIYWRVDYTRLSFNVNLTIKCWTGFLQKYIHVFMMKIVILCQGPAHYIHITDPCHSNEGPDKWGPCKYINFSIFNKFSSLFGRGVLKIAISLFPKNPEHAFFENKQYVQKILELKKRIKIKKPFFENSTIFRLLHKILVRSPPIGTILKLFKVPLKVLF